MDSSPELAAWISAGSVERLLGHEVFVHATATATPGRPPLLLVHGYPTASYDWHRLWPGLAARYSLYALDLLGFGLSAKPRDAAYPIALQADLCEALLERFGIESPHLLAHDYGVTVAQELLARAREGGRAFASACFLNAGLFPESHRPRPIQRLLARGPVGLVAARILGYGSFARSMRRVAGGHPPRDEDLRDLWQLIECNDGRRALVRLIDYMEQRRTHRARWVGAVVDAPVPIRLLCGAADPVSGRHLAERYRELVAEPDVVLLEGVGHYPQLEVPERVLAAYVEFRARIAREVAAPTA